MSAIKPSSRYTHSQLVLTLGGGLAAEDLQKLEAKRQRMVQAFRPLPMALWRVQRSTPLSHFVKNGQLAELTKTPASWLLKTTCPKPARIRCAACSSAIRLRDDGLFQARPCFRLARFRSPLWDVHTPVRLHHHP